MTTTLLEIVDCLVDPLDKPDDHGEVSCPPNVFKLAYYAIHEAESAAGNTISGHPIVTSDGGLRITWSGVPGRVKLCIPNDGKTLPYIYTQLDGDIPTIDSANNLAAALVKLEDQPLDSQPGSC